MNYWYIQRDNEMLLDCDLGFNPDKANHILRIFSREFQLESKWEFFKWTSKTEGHVHVLVEIPPSWVLSPDRKTMLRMMLGSDKHKEIISLASFIRGEKNPFLLVSPHDWSPVRSAEYKCKCLFASGKCACIQKMQGGHRG